MNSYKTCTYCYVNVLLLFRLILLMHSFIIKSELKILLEKKKLFRTMYLYLLSNITVLNLFTVTDQIN